MTGFREVNIAHQYEAGNFGSEETPVESAAMFEANVADGLRRGQFTVRVHFSEGEHTGYIGGDAMRLTGFGGQFFEALFFNLFKISGIKSGAHGHVGYERQHTFPVRGWAGGYDAFGTGAQAGAPIGTLGLQVFFGNWSEGLYPGSELFVSGQIFFGRNGQLSVEMKVQIGQLFVVYHDDSEAVVQPEFLKRRLMFLSGRLCRKQQWEEGEEEEVFHVEVMEMAVSGKLIQEGHYS